MSVRQLHPYPLIPVVNADRSERVLEVLGAVTAAEVAEHLWAQGLRICESCEDWCEPVAVTPRVQCARCLAGSIEAAVIRGIHLKENPKELASRIYRLMVPGPQPLQAS